jgi:hypothetical protein
VKKVFNKPEKLTGRMNSESGEELKTNNLKLKVGICRK